MSEVEVKGNIKIIRYGEEIVWILSSFTETKTILESPDFVFAGSLCCFRLEPRWNDKLGLWVLYLKNAMPREHSVAYEFAWIKMDGSVERLGGGYFIKGERRSDMIYFKPLELLKQNSSKALSFMCKLKQERTNTPESPKRISESATFVKQLLLPTGPTYKDPPKGISGSPTTAKQVLLPTAPTYKEPSKGISGSSTTVKEVLLPTAPAYRELSKGIAGPPITVKQKLFPTAPTYKVKKYAEDSRKDGVSPAKKSSEDSRKKDSSLGKKSAEDSCEDSTSRELPEEDTTSISSTSTEQTQLTIASFSTEPDEESSTSTSSEQQMKMPTTSFPIEPAVGSSASTSSEQQIEMPRMPPVAVRSSVDFMDRIWNSFEKEPPVGIPQTISWPSNISDVEMKINFENAGNSFALDKSLLDFAGRKALVKKSEETLSVKRLQCYSANACL